MDKSSVYPARAMQVRTFKTLEEELEDIQTFYAEEREGNPEAMEVINRRERKDRKQTKQEWERKFEGMDEEELVARGYDECARAMLIKRGFERWDVEETMRILIELRKQGRLF